MPSYPITSAWKWCLKIACGILTLTWLWGSPSLARTDSVSTWEAANFRVWSFIPYWTPQTQLESFPADNMYDHVSDILYFSGVRPTANGNLNYHPWAAGHLATLAAQATENDFRLHMSMFDTYGGSVETVWNSIVSNPTRQANFITQVTNLLQTHGMTGFNLDWERPNTVTEWANYTQLAKDLKSAIEPLGMDLSVDDYGYADPRWDDSPVFDARTYDQLFIMGYHYSAASNNTFANTKLALTGQGAEKAFTDEQLVLGIGTWGKGTVSGQGTKTLKSIVAADPNLAYDATSWSDGTNTWTLQSRAEARNKVLLALDRNMAGVMFWTLHYDATNELSLHRVAHHALVVGRDIPDLNLDGKVNTADAEQLASQMGTVPGWTGTNTAARFDKFYLQGNWEQGDHNGNGFVNQADADWLADRFQTLGIQLPDRLAYTGALENFQPGSGLAGRWRVIADGAGNLPETGNYTQHAAGHLSFHGTGPGANKYSPVSLTLRNQNSAEAYSALNTEPRQMAVDLSTPIDLGQNSETYFTFLIQQNTGTLLTTQEASDQRNLTLLFQDKAGANQLDVSFRGKSGQVVINNQIDAGGESDVGYGLLSGTTYLLVGKISGSATDASKLELAYFSEADTIGNFTEPSFSWMLSAENLIGFNPILTQLAIVSLHEANYTLSNIQIGTAEHFFAAPFKGDFDDDGDTDGADFLSWQRSNPHQGAAWTIWETNFGTTVLQSPLATTVPEPSVLRLLLVGLLGLVNMRIAN